MDEDTREQVVALLTRVGIMAEDLSAIALGAAGVSGQELSHLIDETQRRVFEMAMLSEQAAAIAHPYHSGLWNFRVTYQGFESHPRRQHLNANQ